MTMNERSQGGRDALSRKADGKLQRLLLERELHHVVCRYARLCDERDWSAIDDIFSSDATADYGGRHLPDRAAILAMLRDNLGGCGPTQHLLGNLVVEVDGDIVTSHTAVRAAHRGAGESAGQTYDCLGEYRDRWVRTGGGWRIAHRAMVVTLEFGSRKVLGPAPPSTPAPAVHHGKTT
jgi:3-phenylpropionate/cinnamic acid dioxygenase small subunit